MTTPPRATIRPAGASDIPGIARVHVDTWRSTYRGIVAASHLANLSYEKSEDLWKGHVGRAAQLVTVAEEEGRIVGFVHGGPNRGPEPEYRGELNAIYVLERHQRRGLGRRLTLALAELLEAASLRSMIVWVLRDNPARDFYKSLEGKPAGAKPITLGSQTLEEAGYGWTNLARLLELRVRLAGYDPRWAGLFEEERARLADALGDSVVDIQHIGSTAVPGLASKPVVDILVGLRQYPPNPLRIAVLSGLGYEPRGEAGVAGRLFFRKGAPRTHHVHATLFESGFWASHLRFRDLLRARPQLALAYEQLKRMLESTVGDDRVLYTEAKSAFILKALAESGGG